MLPIETGDTSGKNWRRNAGSAYGTGTSAFSCCQDKAVKELGIGGADKDAAI
jgi:hypothetical protein